MSECFFRRTLTAKCFLGVAVFAAGLTAQTVSIVQTNADRSALLAPQPSVEFGSAAGQEVTINIDETQRFQRMDGFGASFTDSSAWLIRNKLSAAQREELMRNLFTPAGANLSFLRQPMGTTDFALSNYTYDDVPAGETDPNLTRFSIDHDKEYILPAVRDALALNPRITVMGLPWSPPAWMKLSKTLNGGNFDEQYFPALAQYFKKFIAAYGENGVPVKRIAVQNEPLNNNTSYPTEYLTDSQQARFIGRYLGPELIDDAAFSRDHPVQILGYEHNWDVQSYAQTILRDPDASRYTAGTSFHCYAGDPTTAYNTIQQEFPNKGLWFTECSGTVGSNFGGDLGWNMRNLAIGSVRSGVKSVVLWNLALDQNNGPINGGCRDCRGVVTVDTSTTPATVSYNVEYYVLGQAAHFVTPGAYRIQSNSSGNGSIENVAFQNADGSLALLVYNPAQTATPFNVTWKGKSFSYTLPAGSVATFAWQSGVPAPAFAATPAAQTVVQGGVARILLDGEGERVRRVNITGAPEGTNVSVSRNGVALRTSPSTPTGTYRITMTSQDRRAPAIPVSVNLTVGAPATAFNGNVPNLPGLVQAENWDAGDTGIAFYNPSLFSQPGGSIYRPEQNVSIETTSDGGSGYIVGYIGAGQWLQYTANVAQAGLYSLQSRIASQFGGSSYHVEVDGRNVTGSMRFPNTGGWQSFATAGSPTFRVGAGSHAIRYVFDSNNANGGVGNFNWFQLVPAGRGVSQPYGGTPAAVPGIIQMENFDTGGKNVAYYNAASRNQGGQYRIIDTVGIEISTDVGGGYNLSSTEPGQWMNYTVNIADERDYTMHVRVAAPVPGGTFRVACDGRSVTEPVTIPGTGGWQNWQTIDLRGVHLPAGRHVLQFALEGPGVYTTPGNLNWFSFD